MHCGEWRGPCCAQGASPALRPFSSWRPVGRALLTPLAGVPSLIQSSGCSIRHHWNGRLSPGLPLDLSSNARWIPEGTAAWHVRKVRLRLRARSQGSGGSDFLLSRALPSPAQDSSCLHAPTSAGLASNRHLSLSPGRHLRSLLSGCSLLVSPHLLHRSPSFLLQEEDLTMATCPPAVMVSPSKHMQHTHKSGPQEATAMWLWEERVMPCL